MFKYLHDFLTTDLPRPQKCPEELLTSLCIDSLQVMDDSAEKKSYEEAQLNYREELEKVSLKMIQGNFLPVNSRARMHTYTGARTHTHVRYTNTLTRAHNCHETVCNRR